ncbi:MAG: response regulator [Acidobacteriota bacterium]
MQKKILVVDDDPRMLSLERTILLQGGFKVETAPDGSQAIEKARTEKFDGIVLDVMMPQMDGYEVARQIKQIESCRGVPIVMVTATTDSRAMGRGFSSGAVVFMNKPFSSNRFLSVIRTVTESGSKESVLPEAPY